MEVRDYNILFKERAKGHSFTREELELLNKIKGNNVFELGSMFGDRILYLKNKGVNVTGAYEENPNFHSYAIRINKINEHNIMLHSGEFNLYKKYDTIYSYKFLDYSSIKIEDVMKFCYNYIGYENSLGGFYQCGE